jgi:hypothetical protein
MEGFNVSNLRPLYFCGEFAQRGRAKIKAQSTGVHALEGSPFGLSRRPHVLN